jgi:hypothetical protein
MQKLAKNPSLVEKLEDEMELTKEKKKVGT